MAKPKVAQQHIKLPSQIEPTAMPPVVVPRVLLKKMKITNFGPIKADEVHLDDFTYFVGRNNAGKSHYLKAIDLLLAQSKAKADDISKLQHNPNEVIEIEGSFQGVEGFTHLVTASNHKRALEDAIRGGVLTVVRRLHPDETQCAFGVRMETGEIHNPTGFQSNLLQVVPDTIYIAATADTVKELEDKTTTALGKLKREVLVTFFGALRQKTKDALISLDEYLHSADGAQRSAELQEFERHLKSEMVGEFSDVVPSVEFGLPDEQVIAKEMRIMLDDGHKSEVEQKGHGLQRAALLALLRVLARHGKKYQDRPTPIFLVGEFESFLHPYAQRQLGAVLSTLVERYQIVTSTHSPFMVMPGTIEGYRRVRKDSAVGTKSTAPDPSTVDLPLMSRLLEVRGNLEGLFADRVILVEGSHDENFYRRIKGIFQVSDPQGKFVILVKVYGKRELRKARAFYRQLGFDDVAIVCDLDCVFGGDARNLYKELGIDPGLVDQFRTHIGWTTTNDPKLDVVVQGIGQHGTPADFQKVLAELEKQRIFVLPRGAPEMYYATAGAGKEGWKQVNTEADLMDVDYLRNLIGRLFQ